jgi:predicted esterase
VLLSHFKMRFIKLCRLDSQLSRTMGNCFERGQAGNSSSSMRRSSSSSNEATEAAAFNSNRVVKQYKPRILCLHGWRTNGEILSMQMAALQANTSMDCVFIDAPFPGRGEPDKGIALFYPDRPYYEWFYRSKKVENTSDLANTTNSDQPKASAKYENLGESIKFLTDHLDAHGPYDGILGFSQGASMVTRLVKLQEQLTSLPSSTNRIFKFVILIGGVPPQV